VQEGGTALAVAGQGLRRRQCTLLRLPGVGVGEKKAGRRAPGGEDQEGPRRSGRMMRRRCTGGHVRNVGLHEDL
jgi:hypothetical protein